MSIKEKIITLIDKIPEIKENFTTQQLPMASSYDFKSNKRKNSYIQLKTIYKNPIFLDWREHLIYELCQLEEDDLICEIKKDAERFNGWNDEDQFKQLEIKLNILEENIDKYVSINETINDSRIPETELINTIIRALLKLQRNHSYNNNSNEDTMNDYIRDILDESYDTKDQTRQGDSESGLNAGEIDIQICYEKNPIVMIEALKLGSLERYKLDKHINKILTKYDPNGCPYVFLLIYATVINFDDFTSNLFDYLNEYHFYYKRLTNIVAIETDYGELKHYQTILDRNGNKIKVHFFVAHII